MTKIERKIAMESVVLLNKNRDKTIKDRMCSNGSMQRADISCEEVTSLTAVSEAIITTGAIDAKQKRCVVMLDIPNSFV